MKLKILLLILLLFFSACEENYPIYSGFCTKEQSKKVECLKLPAFMDAEDKERIEKGLKLPNTQECSFSLKLTKYHVGSCNNPEVKSKGVGSNGYVRVEIMQNDQCYFRAQNEFDSDEVGAFDRVLGEIIEKL